LRPWHIHRRVSQFEVRHYGEMFHYLQPGELLQPPLPEPYARAVEAADARSFRHATSELPVADELESVLSDGGESPFAG
jgi:hypothetical protein